MDTPKDDPQYLKDYIKEHPTNKMAWYLLGRQYAAKGQHGKAKYCFEQAGEIYHAFESGELFGSDEGKQDETREAEPDAAVNRRRGRGRFWKTLAACVLLLIASYVPLKSDQADSPAAALTASGQLGGDGWEGALPGASAASTGTAGLPDIVYSKSAYAAGNRTGEIAGLLSRFQEKAASGSPMTLLVDPSWSATAQRWLVWPAPAKPIVAVEHSETTAGAHLTYYDAKTCSCEPADATSVLNAYHGWQNVQLQHMIVRSAVTSYQAATGAAPQSIDQLVRNYPDNWLSGYTPTMKRYFDQYTAERRNSADGGSSGAPGPAASPQQPTANSELLPAEDAMQQPLRILVDKTTHTLALVSGDMLIRSYPVGLGGALTPEGEFTITEKVRNPNGRDNGTFGSRGMTLSDTLYAIHGTNQPSSVGKDKSLGCIRMLTPDIEELFDIVPKGTKVTIGQRLQIPSEPYRAAVPLRLATSTDETNPHKTYKWLD